MSTDPKTVAFHTMGCKLNFSETSTISRDFIQQGFKKVNYRDKADIYFCNLIIFKKCLNNTAKIGI